MGSEHYCLRWNNHQSNLLGVFSQLLQDESLVDVTLACSEGASIRAHKVVLSACSSYFQSLFLDHPSRHPIVILKDVRFAELRTIIEFMYKGEVNVQYCQLSALLKTAESLKVKGLAEMTNQSSALREPEREPDHLRPPHLNPKSDILEATAATNAKRLKSERCSPSPTRIREHSSLHHHRDKEQQHHHHQRDRGLHHRDRERERERERDRERERERDRERDRDRDRDREQLHHQQQQQQHSQSRETPQSTLSALHQPHQSLPPPSPPTPMALYQRKVNRDYNPDTAINDEHHHLPPSHSASIAMLDERAKTPEEDDDDDEDDPMHTGINMTINSNAVNSMPPSLSTTSTIVIPPANSVPSNLSPDIPSTRGGSGSVLGNSTATSTCTSSSLVSTSSGITSPIVTEPVAGPSGLGPVQSMPLSLKKEVDWDRSDDKSIGESSSDYRHSHDSEATDTHGGLGPNLHDHGGGGSVQIYPCMYCGANFPHQSKLTRHILSHSLETLKYRESHLLHLTNFPHDLPPQHFAQRAAPSIEPLEPPDGAMDIEFAAAIAAAASSVGGNSTTGGNSDQGSVVLCKFCGKNFPDVSSLITHLPMHTGDRPFKCEYCGKAFKLRHHMKDHCRVHTGERPFRCGMCGKTFSRSTILKAHEKTHFPKYVRKFLSPSPVDTKDEPPQ